MQKQNRFFKIIVAALIILLVSSYAFIMFLPHSHECFNSDCTVCAVIECSRNLLLGIALPAGICHLPEILFLLCASCAHGASNRESTPVGLKVKLSD